jgi:Flp pilus assembly pilin Flp
VTDLLIKAKLAFDGFVADLKSRASDERGALSVEYVGLVIFIVGLVLAVWASGVAGKIATKLQEWVGNILG